MKSLTRLTSTILLMAATVVQAQPDLGVARYNARNQMLFPGNTDEWIHLGSSVGGEYGEEPFDPENPGVLGVVQMEPEAYRYFKQNGEYAEGSMFLLSFFKSEAESSPQLPGFVQGDLNAQEIHVIDSERFSEGRAFFLFTAEAEPGTPSNRMPDGSTCVTCHEAEGDYNGTFSQFYPPIRDVLADD